MPAEPSNFDPQKLWQSQATEHDAMTIAEIHEKARVFQGRIRRRNIMEYVAGVVVLAGFLPVLLYRGSWMMQVGAGLTMAATVFVVWQIRQRGSGRPVPEAGEALIGFHRRELIRQRNALRTVGAWYIAPFVPGMAMILSGRWFQLHAAHRSVRLDHLLILSAGALVTLVMLGIWQLNERGAKRLDKQIEKL